MFSFLKNNARPNLENYPVPNYRYKNPSLWREIYDRKQKINGVESPEFNHLPVFDNDIKEQKDISPIELKPIR